MATRDIVAEHNMSPQEHPAYQFGEFRLEPHRRLLTRPNGDAIALTAKPFDALVYLVEHAGELVTRQALSEALWPAMIVEENSLSQVISVLRRALGDGVIATVSRRGYQFVAAVRVQGPDAQEHAGAAEPPRAAGDPGPQADTGPTAAQAAPRHSRSRRVAYRAAIVTTIALVGWVLWEANRESRGAINNPLDGYVMSKLTEFEGVEEQAAISRDGRFVAFLRERDGRWDVWAGLIGSQHYTQLTDQTAWELRNPAVRSLGFMPDGSHVMIWTRAKEPERGAVVDAGWAVPTFGGTPQPYLRNIAEFDWSADGRRVAFHTAEAGDPMYVADIERRDERRAIHVSVAGLHNHFPLWSRNSRFIYYVHGYPPDEMDVWRVSSLGGSPERLTFHDSSVSFPVWLDERTLLYLATAEDGSGPWAHALDLRRRAVRRLDTGGRAFSSLAASADGHRIVATEVRSTASLWRTSISREAATAATAASRLDIPAARGLSPRISGQNVFFRARSAGKDGLYRLAGGVTTELWSGAQGRVIAGPAVAPDGTRIAFPVRRRGRTQLYVVGADGSDLGKLAEDLDVRGAPAWSPDGNWLAISAISDGIPRLFKIPVAGGAPIALVDSHATDPAWSPSGRFLVYCTEDVGTHFSLKAVNADGTSRALPPLALSRGSRRIEFLDEGTLAVLKGDLSSRELWAVDLRRGSERRLTALGAGPEIHDFDVSTDGAEVVFDRVREDSDIVLMELAP